MSELKQKIKALIQEKGAITVSDYMALALADTQGGYYHTQNPFGREGDFITAPEISQMFGELIGVWVLTSWKMLGKPEKIILCEMGPGRGTLMKDVLRTLHQLSPEFMRAAEIFMIETSLRLQHIQKITLENNADRINWVETFDHIAHGPLIFYANELLDALPIHQFIKQDGKWRERLIHMDTQNNFSFIVGTNELDSSSLPNAYSKLHNGAILELSPQRNHICEMVAKRLYDTHGCALFIDYGSDHFPHGDTLQAISKHSYRDIFQAPGQDDLTSHVDFSSLLAIAKQNNCEAALLTQGDFLLRMGLLERAGHLGANKDIHMQEKIKAQVERLAATDQMGTLFKVLSLSDKKTQLNPIFLADHHDHD
ncbi:class I SAM-dependent methyltransferase [Bartonella tamiae]|uniref:Uncharacterized protein n=1 Tax=Bartonella tamiae Th239 TaxID=1094558 RepID=J1JX53_9HYPH|nr:class I SAM-dependent methyltransferase [Bartonella tamiae]EJF89185.1 hypothetical protein ME5_01736 [Bartonella tamiae Th239]EJF95412.1 hypothetical protein MEG_00145 [Bartonella tamiae Th307]